MQQLESGVPGSLETYCRVTTALDLWPELLATDARSRQRRTGRDQDFVHSAMGELEASRFRSHGFGVGMDEPYQHYQFAGRADVVAWDLESAALLHIENRTAFPNVQEALGSYAAKRSYLADVLAGRLGVSGGRWSTVTHAIVALWSAEVLHVVRLRTESFRAACPDAADGFAAWWAGRPPEIGSTTRSINSTSSFVLLDPSPAVAERSRFASLEDALRVRPRVRDYAEALRRLQGR